LILVVLVGVAFVTLFEQSSFLYLGIKTNRPEDVLADPIPDFSPPNASFVEKGDPSTPPPAGPPVANGGKNGDALDGSDDPAVDGVGVAAAVPGADGAGVA
jgi:hypothetical protein